MRDFAAVAGISPIDRKAADVALAKLEVDALGLDDAEVARFSAMAAEWWDPNGKFKPLHMLNPCRLDYITSQIAAEFGRDLQRREAEHRHRRAGVAGLARRRRRVH